MRNETLKKAVMLAGGQVALADKIRMLKPGCKVKQAHIWGWLHTMKMPSPPAEYVLAICQAVDGQVVPHEMRPDIYPNPGDGIVEQKKVEAA